MSLTCAAVKPDGRTVELVFSGPKPTSFTTPDWIPGATAGVGLTTNSGLTLEEIGNYVTTPGPGSTLVWTVDYLVNNPSSVITFGTGGVTVQAGAGLLQDSVGNTTAGFSGYAVANNSLVDANGFTTHSFQRGTGGATVYVSSTYGSDANSFAQAQNPATPYQSLTQALQAVTANGMNGKGAAIKLLDGDTFTSGGAIKVGGQDAAHPFVIENYWYQYAAGVTDPQTRPVIAIDESSPTAPSSALNTYKGGGTPASLNHVVIRNLNFQAVNWTGNYASRFGLNFLMPGDDWTLDNDVVQNFGTDINVQGAYGTISNMTFLRCQVLDARIDNSVVQQHSQGLFLDKVTGFLLSQSVFDDNGRVSADRTGRDLFSHNIYIQYTCGPTLVWGNTVTNGGSHGLQDRAGGVVAYNYFGGNALAATLDGVGGTFFKNVAENGQDISPTLPRGLGLCLNAVYTSSLSQAAEFNVILNSNGHQPQAVTVDESASGQGLGIGSVLVRHNTALAAGGFVMSIGSGSLPAGSSIVNEQNVWAVSVGKIYSDSLATPVPGYAATENVMSAPSTTTYPTIMGNNNLTLPAWSSASGTESNSLTLAPAYASTTVGLGSYAVSLGVPGASSSNPESTNAQAFLTWLRGRSMGSWAAANAATGVGGFVSNAYTPTNLPSTSDPGYAYFGASAYNSPSTGSGHVLTATAGFEQVALSWAAVPGATNYCIYLSKPGTSEYAYKQIPGTAYTATGLNDDATYTFRVVPYVNGTAGTSSNSVTVVTALATPATSGPAPVLTGVAGTNSVSLSWTALPGVTKYYLYRVSSTGSISAYRQLNSLSYVDTNVLTRHTYRYEVAGVTSAGVGALSNLATVSL